MTANTPKGYTYPVGTDPMSQGDNVLQGLAQAVDTKLGVAASGSVFFSRFASVNPDNATVTLPVGRFSAAWPMQINATPATTSVFSARAAATQQTNTQFTLAAWRESGTGDLTVMWTASQQV